jgi:single-strand DNA-binding protein
MYQKLILVGNLGKDPEMRYTPAGTAVTTFNIATNRTYVKDSKKIKETIWFRISVWGKQGEACSEYLRKGSKVLVEGILSADPATGGPRVWANKEGKAMANFEVNASSVVFLSTAGTHDDPSDGFDHGADEF